MILLSNQRTRRKNNPPAFLTEKWVVLRWVFLIGIVVFAAWYLSTYWYQLMLIQGRSMEPAYHHLQLVLLDKHCTSYQAGDVAAIDCPGLSETIVKRVVAVPGDHVQIAGGSLLVNGSKSTFFEHTVFDYAGLLEKPIFLNEGEYIVIGDNVSLSKDSRYREVGIVHIHEMAGRVIR